MIYNPVANFWDSPSITCLRGNLTSGIFFVCLDKFENKLQLQIFLNLWKYSYAVGIGIREATLKDIAGNGEFYMQGLRIGFFLPSSVQVQNRFGNCNLPSK